MSDWYQLNLEFPDRDTATRVLAHELLPELECAEDPGVRESWWIMRKHPTKVRVRPTDPDGVHALHRVADKLNGDGLTGWTTGIYEPETAAFGGPEAMDVAHTLFHVDSRHVLIRAAQNPPPVLGPRETTVVLCASLFRAAGLDCYEQADVWARVAAERADAPAPPGYDDPLGVAMDTLMRVDPYALTANEAALDGHRDWVAAYEQAGQALAQLARDGLLRRGLRAVLAHHVIFHANRQTLPIDDQLALARLGSRALFAADASHTLPTTLTKVSAVTTLSDTEAVPSPAQLRHELTDALINQSIITSPAVEQAFRTLPRENFVPGSPVTAAYTDNAVYTKHTAAGVSISALSQPRIVAMMLEQLDLRPGHRVLEAGAGTGANAGLMGLIVGEHGHVVTIDVDEDLVTGAAQHLASAGITNVQVLLADGALGHPDGAPYQRFIATVGAYDVPRSWTDQLTPGARMVVPVRLRGVASRSIAFVRDTDRWRSVDSQPAVFMPLRGLGDDARRIVPLGPAGEVTLQVNQDQTVDADALTGVLATERAEQWTGVTFPPNTSFEWMDLYLCLTLPNALIRMPVQKTAIDSGLVTPMLPWGAMATVEGPDLAYLTLRPIEAPGDGGKTYEFGVIGHGPGAQGLADRVTGAIRTWDRDWRGRTAGFELPDRPENADPADGRFVLDREQHPITVIWA